MVKLCISSLAKVSQFMWEVQEGSMRIVHVFTHRQKTMFNDNKVIYTSILKNIRSLCVGDFRKAYGKFHFSNAAREYHSNLSLTEVML